MSAAEAVLLGLLATLSLGAYGYTHLASRELRGEIRRLWTHLTNHQEHRFHNIEERLTDLEDTRG